MALPPRIAGAHAGHAATAQSGAHAGHTAPSTTHDAHTSSTAHATHGNTTASDAHAQHGSTGQARAQHEATAGAHAQHGAAPRAMTSGGASSLSTAGTPALRPDPLDAPAPVAVSESAKAANNVPDGDIRHITPGTDRENPPSPAPAVRERGRTANAPASTGASSSGHANHGAAPQRETASVYTCPMHPEVTSDKPGKCPKCGMALVKKTN